MINDIWPLIEKELPDLHLYIIGSNASKNLLSLRNQNIEVLGFVEDPKDIFLKYRISVAPLRYGAGMKGKVIDSMRYGVPCVISPVAAEGSGLENNHNVLIANSPKEFAQNIVRLYNDRSLWETLAKNGIDYCKKTISTDAISKNIDLMLDKLAL